MNRQRTCSPFTAITTLIIVLLTLILFGKSLKAQEADSVSDQVVILLHGLGRTERSMAGIADYLRHQGFEVVNLAYPSTTFTVEQISALYLTPVIENARKHQLKVHFVTHSMGGIIVRHYLQQNQDFSAGHIVMLAPPNNGSEIVDTLGEFRLFNLIMGPAAGELATGPDSWVNMLDESPATIGIIAGDRSCNPIFSTMIAGDDDGKVSVDSTRLSTMRDHLTLPVSHTFIMDDPEVRYQTAHFLKHSTFDQ